MSLWQLVIGGLKMKIKDLKIYLENIYEQGKYKLKGTKTGYASIDLPQSNNASLIEKYPFIPGVDFVSILKLKSKGNRYDMAIDCDLLHATYQQLLDDSHQLYLALAVVLLILQISF